MHSSDYEALEPRLLLDAAAAITLDAASQIDVSGPGEGSLPATEDSSFKLSGVSVTDDNAGGEGSDSYALEITLNAAATEAGSGLALDGAEAQSSLTLTGSRSEINALIDTIDVLPGADYTGALSIQLTLREGSDVRDSAVIDALITPVNDAPVLAGGEAPVQEGGSYTFSPEALGLSDPDIDSGEQGLDQLIVQIDAVPSDGKLTFNNAPVAVGSTFDASQLGKLKYIHSGNDVAAGASDSFSVTVFDGAGGEVSGSLTITLEPKNQAPAIAGDPVQYEGETTSLGLGYDDVESNHADAAANAQIEIIDTDGLAGRGTLFLDVNQDGIVDDAEIISNSSSDYAAFTADMLALLSFAHDGDEPLSQKPSFTLRVTDNGGGEGDGGILSTIRAVDITVLENNDDPVVVNLVSPTDVASGDNGVLIGEANLRAEDPDSAATQLVYSIVSGPDYGQIQLNLGDGANPNWVALPATAVFTQADVNAGKVRYVQTTSGEGVTEDTGFTFKLADSEFRAFDSEGQAGKWRDADSNELTGSMSFQITDDTGAAVDELDSNVVVDSSINEGRRDFAEGASDITITADDLSYVLTAGGTYTLPDSQVVYSVSRLPAHGTLFLDGNALGLYSSFTQADINESRVTFTHNGGENHQDSFSFIVTNGGNFRTDSSFVLNALPVNDAPETGTSTISVVEATELSDGIVRLGIDDLQMSDVDGSEDVTPDASDDPNMEAQVDNLWFQITALPEDGVLERWNGSDWIEVELDGNWYSQALLSSSADGGVSGLRYIHGGDDAVANLTDSLTFIVRDDLGVASDPLQPDTASADPAAGNVSGTGTVNIEVIPFNDAPIVAATPDAVDITITDADGKTLTTANNVLTVNEGATGAISSALLTAVDSDNTTRQATFRVGESVSNGKLLLDGKQLNAGSTFTQADIDQGLLSYEHDGLETRSDSFTFVVSDGPLVTGEARFDIEIIALNDMAGLEAVQPAENLVGEAGLTLGSAFTVTDVDILDAVSGLGISDGETDTIKLTLVLQDLDGVQVPGGLDRASLNVDLTGVASVEVTSGIPGTDTKLVLTGTLADIQTVLTTLTAVTKTDLNQGLELVATVDDRINDGAAANGGLGNESGDALSDANNTASARISLVASTTNDAPTGTTSDQTLTEDQPTLLTGLSVDDADSFDRAISVTVTVGSGSLDVAATSGVNVSNNGASAVTLNGTVGDVNAALAAMTFTPPENTNGTITLDVSITDSDLHGNGTELTTDLAQSTISIDAVNDAPTLSVPGTQVFASGDSLAIPGISVADANDSGATEFNDSQTVTVTVLSGENDAPGTLETDSQIAATSLTLTGTLAEINAELDTLVFRPENANNDAVARIEITVNDDSNGDETVDPANSLTATDIVQVNISGLNDAPGIAGDTTANAAEDVALALDFLTITDTDDFGNSGMSLTLSVTHGTFASALGVLSNGNRTLTLDNATKAELNALLADVRYTADANYYGSDTLSLSVNDGGNTGEGPVGGESFSQDVAITVASVNDRPIAVLSNVDLPVVSEGTAETEGAVLSTLLDGAYDDSTDNQAANNGGSAPDRSTVLSYVAIIGNPATAEQGQWQVVIDGNWVTVPSGVSDSGALVVSADTRVRFLPSVDFNGVPESLTLRLGDASQTISESVGAGDLRDLNTNGNLASESGVWSSTGVAINTTVTAVNDAPVITQAEVALSSVAEDDTNPAGATVQALIGESYSDATDDQTQEAVSGGSNADAFGGIAVTGQSVDADQGLWQYNTGSGWTTIPADVEPGNALILDATALIRFLPAADFNGVPTGLDYVVADTDQSGVSGSRADVSYSSTGTWSDSASAGQLVTEVLSRNDAPTLSVDVPAEGTPAIAVENAGNGTGSASVSIAANTVLGDIDARTGEDSFAGGNLTIAVADPTSADIFEVDSALAAFESQTLEDGSLTVTFSDNATAADVAALIDSLTYRNTSDAPDESKRAFTLFVDDGNNNGQSGGPASLSSNTVTGYLQVQNTNDLPRISIEGGDSTAASLTEANGNLNASGTLSVQDLDTSDTVTALVNSVAVSGSTEGAPSNADLLAMMSVDSGSVIDGTSTDGTVTWQFDSAGEAFDYLAVGESLVLTYTIQVADSAGGTAEQLVTLTINGSNDGAIVSSANESLSETDAPVSASGTLTSTDVDNADNAFTANTITGAIGEFSIDAAGAWTFTANDSFDSLNVGENVTETYNVTSIDGTASSVVVTIEGTNDTASVSSATRTLTETDAPLATSGTLTSTDVDNADNVFTADTITGTIGEFSIDAAGAWTFTASENFDGLNVGDNASETFTVTTVDGSESTVAITITGTNDAATVSSANVTLSETDAAVSTSGTLTSADIDNADNTFTATALSGTIGDFSLATDGTWTFTANDSFDYLNVGESVNESFNVASVDGTASMVTVTINGTNDAPSVSVEVGDASGTSLDEANAGLTDSGTLSVIDRDTSDTVSVDVASLAVTGETNGLTQQQLSDMLTVDSGDIINDAATAGTLSWTFDSANEPFDHLAAGESLELAYTVAIADANGAVTNQLIVVTINGTNDGPVVTVGVDDSAGVTLQETNDTLSHAGTLGVSDVDLEDRVFAAVSDVNAVGDTASIDTQTLLGMLTVDSTAVVSDGETEGTLSWAFDTQGEAFNHLAEGETLTLNFTVTVTDSAGATADRVVSIVIEGTQDAPVIVTTRLPAELAVNDSETIEPLDVSVAFADSDNDSVLIYAADNLPSGLVIDPQTGVITGTLEGNASQTGSDGKAGIYNVVLTATDADGNVGETTITVRVENPAPETVDIAATLEEDNVLTASGNALTDAAGRNLHLDIDGDVLSVSAVNGLPVGDSATVFQGDYGQLTIDKNGNWSYVLRNDLPEIQQLEQNQIASDRFIVTVDDGQGGQTPAVLSLNVSGMAEAVIVSQPVDAGLLPFAPLVPDTGAGADGASSSQDSVADSLLTTESDPRADDFYRSAIQPVQLTVALRDVVTRQSVYEFSLPVNAFESSSDEEINIEATASDGSPLPDYVTFDGDSGTFRVNRDLALAEGVEKVAVKVTGRDESGNEASATFVIHLIAEDGLVNAGTDSSSEQGSSEVNPEKTSDARADTESEPKPAGEGAAPLSDVLSSVGRQGFDAEHSDILATLTALIENEKGAVS